MYISHNSILSTSKFNPRTHYSAKKQSNCKSVLPKELQHNQTSNLSMIENTISITNTLPSVAAKFPATVPVAAVAIKATTSGKKFST